MIVTNIFVVIIFNVVVCIAIAVVFVVFDVVAAATPAASITVTVLAYTIKCYLHI